MTLTYVITAIVLLVYLVGVWFLGDLLKLQSPDIWVLRAGLAVIGIGAAAGFIWWRRSRLKAAANPQEPLDASNEIDVLLRDAEGRLAKAKVPQGSRIANFPLIFLVGESGSAKTSVVVNSGLEPELLAGHVYQENNIVPTRSANLWFTRNTIFTEAGGRLLVESGLWSRAVRRMRGGQLSSVVGRGDQAPRAALVCFDAEKFTQQSVEATVAAARGLHDRLLEISSALGINFPVYVLFTRMDRLPYFREFVRNLSNEEASQVVGATLPLSGLLTAGVYGEQQAARVGTAFDNVFRGLCDARPELLVRENDPNTQPNTYEFPREFRKLRGVIVQFLVDLCRPSALTTAPFLRGFYFSGVRPVVVNEMAPAEALAPEQRGLGAPSGATGIFQAGQRQQAQAAARSTGARRVAQWMFLSHLFNDIMLQDRSALAASSSSTKTSFARRVLLACACLLCLILGTGFLVSWIRNRGLEGRALEAARGISAGESTGQDLPSVDALQKLETLRQTVAEISMYEREGPPWSMRWFLYAGSDLYPSVRRVYFSRFRQLLFGQTQAAMLGGLQRLPSAVHPDNEYGPTYDMLKAYLITTSHHEKSTREFLPPVLMRHWTAGRTVDQQRSQLAQLQFDFYTEELRIANPYSADNNAPAIASGRRYLSLFAGTDRVYQNMLTDAAKTNKAIQYNRWFPGSAETVVDTYEVPGAFSKGGWDFMKDALKNVQRYFSGEEWVLGQQTTTGFDAARVAQQLREKYNTDFVTHWRKYIHSAQVVKYASIADAAKKLLQLSGNQSNLLALFWLASQNTNVDDPKVAGAFQAIHTVVPPASVDRYIAPSNQQYVASLGTLQTSLEQVANQPGPPNEASAAPVLNNATAAKSASRGIAQAFTLDNEGKVPTKSQTLLEDPITYVEALLRTLGPAELNGKGKGFCGQLQTLTRKYPFLPTATQQATLAEVNAILRKPDGALWQFYDTSLQKILPRQGNQYAPAQGGPITLTPAFVAWFNRMAALSDAMYPAGAQDPRISYTLKPVASEGIQDLTLRLDGQILTTSAANTAPKQFTWPGTGVREAKATVKFGGTELGWSTYEGLWAVFQFFEEAERWQPAGSGWQLEWIVRTGKNPLRLPSGNPLTVRFELNMGGAPPVFEKGYLSRLGCVADVAK